MITGNSEAPSSHLSSSSQTSINNEFSGRMNMKPSLGIAPNPISLESILSHSSNADMRGPASAAALCNDPTGLCLGSRGKIDTSRSGLYTKIIRLASRLDPYDRNTHSDNLKNGGEGNLVESENGMNDNFDSEGGDNIASNFVKKRDDRSTAKSKNYLESPPPFVSIETDCSAIFVKEYDGHTIVLRVPTDKGEIGSSTTRQNSTELSDASDNGFIGGCNEQGSGNTNPSLAVSTSL